MRLSRLQKYTLLKALESSQNTISKSIIFKFYPDQELKNNFNSIQVRTQKSLENMVKNNLVASYGHKTAKKFYIEHICLTEKGKKTARQLIQAKQRKLPIK